MRKFLFLTIACFSFLFYSCDKNGSDMTKCNGEGQVIYTWGNDEDIDVYEVNLWMNNEAILFYTHDSREVDWSMINKKDYFPYYNFSMSKVYQLINDNYDVNINSSTPADEIPGEITLILDEVKRLKNYYQFVAEMNGGIILFNRISTVNYN